ncbi:hypothetical protein M407DRAFT_241140, partial [Tulasnella calospora MUT 4182]
PHKGVLGQGHAGDPPAGNVPNKNITDATPADRRRGSKSNLGTSGGPGGKFWKLAWHHLLNRERQGIHCLWAVLEALQGASRKTQINGIDALYLCFIYYLLLGEHACLLVTMQVSFAD